MRLSGEFTGVEYTGSDEEAPASLTALAAEATVRPETRDGDAYTVGGRGAYAEHVAGERFTVERVEGSSVGVERP